MSIERELGEISTQIKNLVKVTESLDSKVDGLATNQAVLMDKNNNRDIRTNGAIIASIGAILTVLYDFFRGQ